MLKHLLTALMISCGLHFAAAQLVTPPSGANQKSIVTQYIGSIAHVSIIYNSPDVTATNGDDRKGKIWGQLVPYGMTPNNFGSAQTMPWRAGANENTIIKFSHDMLVQGKPIKAGKYGFHIIPQENGPWTLIFSKNSSSWGSYFYDQAEDALRVETEPEASGYSEWLTYEFTDRQPNHAVVALRWEDLSIPFKIEVSNNQDLYLAKMRDDLRSSKGFTWNAWVTAANYCLQNNTNLDEALTWADNAISTPFIGQPNFTTLSTKAAVLNKLERTAEAEKVMKKAIKHPTANAGQIHQYGRQLIAAGQKDKALEVFKMNFEKFEKAWPTHVGMARGYSAVGQYEKALKHAKLAHEQAPDKLNKDNLAQSIEKLKAGQDIN